MSPWFCMADELQTKSDQTVWSQLCPTSTWMDKESSVVRALIAIPKGLCSKMA
jgi:hypothetical protein